MPVVLEKPFIVAQAPIGLCKEVSTIGYAEGIGF
jgi:hypothetical protein